MIVYASVRLVSLGSVLAAATFPLWLWLFHRPPALIWLGFAGAALVIGKHHGNIKRLLSRVENRL